MPIASNPTLGPVDPALAARLAELVASGESGARTFDALVGQAETLTGAAGPARSESWIVAQQAVSGLEGARAASTRALGNIDGIAAARVAGAPD